MGKVSIGLNLEYVRHADKPFEWGVAKAAEMGYEYIEPMVHFGRELMSEAGYFHTVSLFDDPLRMPIDEQERIVPGSPYGESKHTLERMLTWLDRLCGLRYAALRYFNAAGGFADRGEAHQVFPGWADTGDCNIRS